MRTVRRGLSAFLAVLALGLSAGGVAAQPADPLTRQELKTQEMQKYVADVLRYAEDLARQGRGAEALKEVQKAADVVKGFPDLADSKRNQMVINLAQAERKYDNELRNPRTVPTPVVRQQPPQIDHKAAYDQASKTLQSRGAMVVDARGLRDEQARRYIGVMTDIDRANLPPLGDYELPADWAERSKRRIASANPMSERERAILKTLNKTLSVEFKGDKFEDVINYLQKATDQPIIVDRAAMQEANVTYDGTTVNLKMTSTTRSVLKKMLAEVGLTYVIKDETIYVTTPARAKDLMTIRTYYVGDLISGDPRFGLVGSRLQMNQQVNQLLVLIQQTVDPDSWEYRNGPGAITFDPVTMTFVVRQSAEVHYMLGVGMRR